MQMGVEIVVDALLGVLGIVAAAAEAGDVPQRRERRNTNRAR